MVNNLDARNFSGIQGDVAAGSELLAEKSKQMPRSPISKKPKETTNGAQTQQKLTQPVSHEKKNYHNDVERRGDKKMHSLVKFANTQAPLKNAMLAPPLVMCH